MIRRVIDNHEYNHGNFDSYLQVVNVRDLDTAFRALHLVITLRICLLAKNQIKTMKQPVMAAGNKEVIKEYQTNVWPVGYWDLFKKSYLSESRMWDSRFELTNYDDNFKELNIAIDFENGHYVDKSKVEFFTEGHFWGRDTFHMRITTTSGRVIKPSVLCRLNLILEDTPQRAHRTIECLYIDKSRIGSGAWVQENPLASDFRSNAITYDVGDLLYARHPSMDGKRDLYQSTFAHEIGHALGIDHAAFMRKDDVCMAAIKTNPKEGQNNGVCYVNNHIAEIENNIMALGNDFSEYEAKPWLHAIKMHTNNSNWKQLIIN